MSIGTISLTNGSASVTGTGTKFTTDTAAANFVIVVVGGTSYSLAVDKITSDTSLTLVTKYDGPTQSGLAWVDVPYGAQMRMTQELGNNIARLMNYYLKDKENWNGILTGPGDVTVTFPDGSQQTGPSWPELIAAVQEGLQIRGEIAAGVDLNTLGSEAGIWFQAVAVNATASLHYPESNIGGTLEVIPHRQGMMQRYTSQSGKVYIRAPSGQWNGTDGPWSAWAQLGVSEYKSSLTGGQSRLVSDKLSDEISVMDFTGADYANRTANTAAITSALKAGNTVIIPSGVTVNAVPSSSWAGNLVIDGTLNITDTGAMGCDVIVRSGAISVAAGKKLTMTGSFKAPERQIFTGAGVVVGINTVKPEWWGASRTANSASAIEAAFNCAMDGVGLKRKAMFINSMTIERTVTLMMKTQGHIDIIGGGNNIAGGRLVVAESFAGSVAMKIVSDGVNDIASFRMSDFAVENNSTRSVVTAYQFGDLNAQLSGICQNVISRVSAHGFGYSFDVINSRMLTFEACASWANGAPTSNGIRLRTLGAAVAEGVTGAFVGDCRIFNCQFEPAGAGSCFAIQISIDNHQCKGVVMSSTALYKSTGGTQFIVAASAGGIIGDVFIDASTQWDGVSKQMINITSDGAGSYVDDIIFNGVYLRGASDPQSVRMVASNGGVISNVRMPNCWLANAVAPVIYADGVKSLSICGSQFHDITTGGGTTHCVVATNFSGAINNNLASRTGAANFYGFIQIGGSSNDYQAQGNSAGGIPTNAVVTDAGSGARKFVGNNF